MIRLTLAGAAIAVLATGAFAQSSSSTDPSAMPASSAMASSVMSSQMSDASSMESSMMTSAPADMSSAMPAQSAPFTIISGYTRATTDQLATKIIGATVYDGTATDANNLGKINDLVLDHNGNIAAVVLGVGGFLGIGEKQVAVEYSALQWATAADNTNRFVLPTTKDELTQAPDFQTVDNSSPMASSQANASMDPALSSSATAIAASSSSM